MNIKTNNNNNNKRSISPELIDLGPKFYTKEEYYECLYQLGRIGKYLGTNNVMLKIFKNLPFKIDSILDVGCGSGIFAIQVAQNIKHAFVLGTDISNEAIIYAQEQKKIFKEKNNIDLNNLKFELRTNPELNESKKSFDIVTSTLVLHHLSDQDIVNFLKNASIVAKKAIIINDLHRNWIAYKASSFIMPLFFPNRLVEHDSLLSIKKAFIYDELKDYLKTAGFSEKNYTITWHWPFRWIIRIIL